MSLILEALKKSEAKRRLGEAPDLGTPFATARRSGRALPLLVFAIVIAGAVGWWVLRQPTPAGTPGTTVPAQKHAAATPAIATKPTARAPTQRPPAVAQNPPASDVQQPKPAQPRAVMPPAQTNASPWVAMGNAGNFRGAAPAPKKLPPNMRRIEPAAQAANKSPAAPAGAKTASVQPATAAQAPGAPALAASVQPVAATAAPSAPALAKAPKTPDMRGLTPPAAAAPKTAEPAPAAVQPAAPVAAKPDVPFYYELPFNVRKTLPQLRLSMHVYAGDPAQRFVVLNDSRLAEGDKTADDVTLREVRKDGAVLEFQGQRFFYPRDGY